MLSYEFVILEENGVACTFGLDDIYWEDGIVCNTAANLTAVPTSSSVQVSWDAVPGALGYQIQGRKAGMTSFRSRLTGSNTMNVNSLLPITTYEWQVQVQCPDGSISDYSPLNSFTTSSAKLAAPIQPVLFPNPAKDLVRVTGLVDGAQWELIDLSGRVLKAGVATAEFVDIQLDLNAGLYLLDWSDGEQAGILRLSVLNR